jgi:hypothetical protein
MRTKNRVNVASNLSRFRRWANKLVEIMTIHKRTEITVQTDRILIMRRRRSKRVWCEKCGCEVDVVSFDGSGTLAGNPHPMSATGMVPDRWHVCHNDGEQWVCLESLLSSLQTENEGELRAKLLRRKV